MPVEDSFSASPESRLLIQQMRESLGLLRVAFDSTGEAMLIVDESSAVRWANQQAAAAARARWAKAKAVKDEDAQVRQAVEILNPPGGRHSACTIAKEAEDQAAGPSSRNDKAQRSNCY